MCNKTSRFKGSSQGFALLEALGAIVILGFGLVALASVMARMTVTTTDSRYMSTQALLASEKLDDLSHYVNCDPAVAAVGGVTGSLTLDITGQNVTSECGTAGVVDYTDTVMISSGNGSISETVIGTDPATGATTYTTSTLDPSGLPPNPNPQKAAPPIAPDTVTFKRRWVIEPNPADLTAFGSTKVERITVAVSLVDNLTNAPVFQASIVRPAGQL
jgi:Tfp pilus assembly protein PilV